MILPFTVYVSPFLVYEGKNGSGEWQYSKHFYAGGERIASKIGSKYTDPTSNTSGDREWNNETTFPYGQKAILVQLEAMIQTMDLGDPSLIPTYRNYVNPYDTINECLEGFSSDDYEEERCICMWFPDQADSTLNCNTERTYWYHSDYIGHTEFITDEAGRPYQYMAYMPFGEQYVDHHANNGFYSSAFRFNGKEYDEYTGQYYYGARYHDPLIGIWLSPDPMFFARPNLTPYNFVQNNPIMLWDPTGMLDSGGDPKKDKDNGKMPDDRFLDSNPPDGGLNWDYKDKYLSLLPTKNIPNVIPASAPGPLKSMPLPIGNEHSISEYKKDAFDTWSESSNLLATISYETVNAFSIVLQGLNPFDNQITSLTGEYVGNQDRSHEGVEVAFWMIPASKGSSFLPKLLKSTKTKFFLWLGNDIIRKKIPQLGKGEVIRIGISTKGGRQVFRITARNRKKHILDIDLGQIPNLKNKPK